MMRGIVPTGQKWFRGEGGARLMRARLELLVYTFCNRIVIAWFETLCLICSMKTPLLSIVIVALLLIPSIGTSREVVSRNEAPNVVVIFVDDLGYADIGPFGGQLVSTPNLDRMAREGRRFTNFHVSSAVCSASRAALITGCYHERVGFHGALGPSATTGLSSSEVTLGEICKQKGYATT